MNAVPDTRGTVLVTGASGFIGSWLTRALAEAGHRVLGISRTGRFPPEVKKRARTLKLDITNKRSLSRLDQPIRAVFHTAIHASKKPETDDDLRRCIETNALGTLNLLEFCRDRGILRFIYSTSIGAYGGRIKSPIGETHPILPETAYGMGKRMGEMYCERYHQAYGIQHFILRYSSVYGYNQEPGTVLPIFIDRARKGLDLVIFGDGKKKQDFVYIKDVIRANLLALEAKTPGYYQIGSGAGTSMYALARAVKKVFGEGRNIRVLRDPDRTEDASQIWLDITRAGKHLKYRPRYDLERGLRDYQSYLDARP